MATLRRHGNAFTYLPTSVYIFEYVREPSKHKITILLIFVRFRQWEVTCQNQSTTFLDIHVPRTSCSVSSHYDMNLQLHFEHMVHRICPAEIQLNKANASDTEAAF